MAPSNLHTDGAAFTRQRQTFVVHQVKLSSSVICEQAMKKIAPLLLIVFMLSAAPGQTAKRRGAVRKPNVTTTPQPQPTAQPTPNTQPSRSPAAPASLVI